MSEAQRKDWQPVLKPLSVYQGLDAEGNTRQAIQLLDHGIRQKGNAYERAVFKIAYYLAYHRNCDFVYAKQVLRQWTWQKCSPELYNVQQAFAIIDRICYRVYYKPIKRFNVRSCLSEWDDAEVKEIDSVTDNSLRLLYAILYRHCKYYGGSQGQFYMTYRQMSESGSGKNRSRLKEQIEALAKLGKVEIRQANFAPKGKMLKSPNEYYLPHYVSS